MRGTEKQINWASEIREAQIEAMRSLAAELASDGFDVTAFDAVIARMQQLDLAKYWIDTRDSVKLNRLEELAKSSNEASNAPALAAIAQYQSWMNRNNIVKYEIKPAKGGSCGIARTVFDTRAEAESAASEFRVFGEVVINEFIAR